MNAEPLVPLAKLLEALEDLGIPYAIGGSLAASVWGEPRSTNDVDLIAAVEEHHVAPLVAALGKGFYADEELIREAVAREAAFNVIHLATSFKLDVFVSGAGRLDRAQLETAVVHPFGTAPPRPCRVTSPEVLVLRKLAWYRLGGETSERQWRDVLGILRVQQGRLDEERMRRLAAELELSDLFERALGGR